MTTTTKNPDITIRGGLISVPNSNKPVRAPRHQPNTPTNKKTVTARADYQIPPPIQKTTTTETEPEQKSESTDPKNDPNQ